VGVFLSLRLRGEAMGKARGGKGGRGQGAEVRSQRSEVRVRGRGQDIGTHQVQDIGNTLGVLGWWFGRWWWVKSWGPPRRPPLGLALGEA